MAIIDLGNELYTGLSTDTKPTTGIPAGAFFIQTDTPRAWIWNATSWFAITLDTIATTLTNKTISGASNTFSNIPKSALPGTTVYTDQANSFGAFNQDFGAGLIRIRTPNSAFVYTIQSSNTATNRTATLPLLTADDIFVFAAFAQTLTNKTLDAGLNTIKNIGTPDYTIYIDAADSNKYKARNNSTGLIDYTHATDAAFVINSAATALGTAGGIIQIGTGTFTCNSTINIRSHQSIIGAGSRATILKLANGNNGAILFFLYSPSFTTLQWTNGTGGDLQCTVARLSLDGNKANNTGTTHGLTKYGYDWRIYDIAIHDFTGHGLVSQWSSSAAVPPDPNDLFCDHVHDITVHDNNGIGIWHMGPNNSFWRGMLVYRNGEQALLVQTIPGVIDGGFQISDFHFFSNNQNHLAPNATFSAVEVESYLKMSHGIIESDAGFGLRPRTPQTISYTPAGGVATNGTSNAGQVWADGLQCYNYDHYGFAGTVAAVCLATTGNYVNGEWDRMNLYAPGGTAVLILADDNKVDGLFQNNTDLWGTAGAGVGSTGTTAVQIGNGTTAVKNCYISGNFYNNAVGINWGNSGNANNIVVANITTFAATGNATAQIDVSGLGSAANTNVILINSSGTGTNNASGTGLVGVPLNQVNAVTVVNKTLSGLSNSFTNIPKSALPGTTVYTDQTNTWGSFAQIFPSSQFEIQNPAATFQYIFVGSAILANRNVTLPLLTAADTFAFAGFANAFSGNNTFTGNNTITAGYVYGNAVGALIAQNRGLLIYNPLTTAGYYFQTSALTANRNVTLPLLTADDTFAFLSFSQTWGGTQTFPSAVLSCTDPTIAGIITGPATINPTSNLLDIKSTGASALLTVDFENTYTTVASTAVRSKLRLWNSANQTNSEWLEFEAAGTDGYEIFPNHTGTGVARKLRFWGDGASGSGALILNTDNSADFNSNVVTFGSNYHSITEIAQPASPASGTRRVYVDSTSHDLTVVHSDGTVIDLEAGQPPFASTLGTRWGTFMGAATGTPTGEGLLANLTLTPSSGSGSSTFINNRPAMAYSTGATGSNYGGFRTTNKIATLALSPTITCKVTISSNANSRIKLGFADSTTLTDGFNATLNNINGIMIGFGVNDTNYSVITNNASATQTNNTTSMPALQTAGTPAIFKLAWKDGTSTLTWSVQTAAGTTTTGTITTGNLPANTTQMYFYVTSQLNSNGTAVTFTVEDVEISFASDFKSF